MRKTLLIAALASVLLIGCSSNGGQAGKTASGKTLSIIGKTLYSFAPFSNSKQTYDSEENSTYLKFEKDKFAYHSGSINYAYDYKHKIVGNDIYYACELTRWNYRLFATLRSDGEVLYFENIYYGDSHWYATKDFLINTLECTFNF